MSPSTTETSPADELADIALGWEADAIFFRQQALSLSEALARAVARIAELESR